MAEFFRKLPPQQEPGGSTKWLDGSNAAALLQAEFFGAGAPAVQGDLAATEAGADEFDASGSVVGIVSGEMVAVEAGADSMTADGQVKVEAVAAGITDNTWLWRERGKIKGRRKKQEPIAPEEYDDEIIALLMVA